MDADDARHRRDEEDRKEKRRHHRENKSASQREKEKRRAIINQKTLQAVNRRSPPPPPHGSSSSSHRPPHRPNNHSPHPPKHHGSRHRSSKPRPPPPPSPADSTSGTSRFQALFSKRAEGFLIDLDFRNAPPRPPVGPCFVGPGLDGELHDKWTRYKPGNAIERGYVWKLHGEPDLGVPIAPSALDYEGCYVDPKKRAGGEGGDGAAEPKLHPDDARLIDWTGDGGDSVMKELERRRVRARALRAPGSAVPVAPVGGAAVAPAAGPRSRVTNVRSRVLRESIPFFMKKTTYLDNDQSKHVHKFKSLQQTKTENAREIKKKLEKNRKLSDKDGIEQAFEQANGPAAKKPRRKHPVKRGVEALYEIPFVPDGSTWGHTFTHVVVDHLPKKTAPAYHLKKKNDANGGRGRNISNKMLEKAFIGDVFQSEENKRMECNFLLPDDTAPKPAKTAGGEEAVFYDAASAYDLDIVPLKEGGRPCVNFLIAIDERGGMATYHPLSSKIQLSTGRRPGDSRDVAGGGKRKRFGRYVGRREMEGEDVREMEGRLAEIDRDFKGDDDDDEEDDGMDGNQQNAGGRKSHSAFGDDDSDSDDGY